MKECKKRHRGCLNDCEESICPVVELLNNYQELGQLDYIKSIRNWKLDVAKELEATRGDDKLEKALASQTHQAILRAKRKSVG